MRRWVPDGGGASKISVVSIKVLWTSTLAVATTGNRCRDGVRRGGLKSKNGTRRRSSWPVRGRRLGSNIPRR
ncbi:unnamed protein product [Linum trigynum]|uniref:Secreted protein n=1 Tax=Linum trigynum TaxID=586398 RepID=A0AAV2E331_9ROSI